MEKNLCVPMLMVMAFVAIVASLFAGPLTEYQPPTIDAYIGETLFLEYSLGESEPLEFVSGGGVEIHQQTDYHHGALVAHRVMFDVLTPGPVNVYVQSKGVSYLAFIIDVVDPSPENPPADGPRDISRFLEPARNVKFRVPWVDDETSQVIMR